MPPAAPAQGQRRPEMAAADAPAAAPQQRGADGAFITALRSEVNTLRGIGSLGGPALDCDIDDDPSRDPSIGVEALEMAQAAAKTPSH